MTDRDPLHRLVPELDRASFPDEPLAACTRCPMAARPHPNPDTPMFSAPARCCTYHPTLPNWLAGRALRRGGVGAERVRARLADPAGVSAEVLGPGPERAHAWKTRADDAFGRDASLTCPFWVPGDLGCSIHADRNAVCRTWFCRVERGARGVAAWTALKTVRTDLEMRLAERCVTDGDPPAEGSEVEAWEAWYRWCADHVDALGADTLAGPRTDALLDRLRAAIEARDARMPDVLRPVVQSWVVRDDGVLLTSWSPYDPVSAPPWIFQLLAALDGQRPWRDAVAHTERALGHPVADEWVWRLWARGLLEAPADEAGPEQPRIDVLPGV